MIKNIIFDLGNVLLMNHRSSILDQMNLTKEQYEDIKNSFFANWEELDLGNSSLGEHLNKCSLKYNIDDNIKYKLLNYYKFRPFNIELVNIMNNLKQNNYNMYILSNNNKETIKYLMDLPLFKEINGFVVSCDYKIMKPSIKLYQILFDKYNLNPEECFFIDDKEENINAGKFLGMNGCVFNSNSSNIIELINEFKKVNIQI